LAKFLTVEIPRSLLRGISNTDNLNLLIKALSGVKEILIHQNRRVNAIVFIFSFIFNDLM